MYLNHIMHYEDIKSAVAWLALNSGLDFRIC